MGVLALHQKGLYQRNRQRYLPNKNTSFLDVLHYRWAAITAHKPCLFPFNPPGAVCKYANMISSVVVVLQGPLFTHFLLIHKSTCMYLDYVGYVTMLMKQTKHEYLHPTRKKVSFLTAAQYKWLYRGDLMWSHHVRPLNVILLRTVPIK